MGTMAAEPVAHRPPPPASGTVRLGALACDASLILVPLRGTGAIAEMQRACFAYRFEAFRAHPVASVEPRQWPLLEP